MLEYGIALCASNSLSVGTQLRFQDILHIVDWQSSCLDFNGAQLLHLPPARSHLVSHEKHPWWMSGRNISVPLYICCIDHGGRPFSKNVSLPLRIIWVALGLLCLCIRFEVRLWLVVKGSRERHLDYALWSGLNSPQASERSLALDRTELFKFLFRRYGHSVSEWSINVSQYYLALLYSLIPVSDISRLDGCFCFCVCNLNCGNSSCIKPKEEGMDLFGYICRCRKFAPPKDYIFIVHTIKGSRQRLS